MAKQVATPAFMNTAELCELLGISRQAINTRYNNGRLPPPYRLGGRVALWRRSEVKAWQAGKKAKPDTAPVYDPTRFYRQDEAAAMIGLKGSAFGNWRSKKCGPFYYKKGKEIRYRGDDLNDWLVVEFVRAIPKPDPVFVRIDPATGKPAPRPVEVAQAASKVSPSEHTAEPVKAAQKPFPGPKKTLTLANPDKALADAGAWFGPPGTKPVGESL